MKTVTDFKTAEKLLERRLPYSSDNGVESSVKEIIENVKKNGDKAVLAYTERFDGAKLKKLEVSERERAEVKLSKKDPALYKALKLAAGNIERFHKTCMQKYGNGFLHDGLGQQILPLERVGLYVPGGTASYPSTVLMTAIPARVAGVKEIIMVTPCGKGGKVPAHTLAAANMAGVDRIFKTGGAQAIAALAFGTQSIPRVDKICGPGNIYVMTAKKLVYGVVDIDALQGPSEIVVIADDRANAAFCAADLIAQSEHDVLASSIFITTSADLARKVQAELKKQLAGLKRNAIAAKALDTNGIIVIVKNIGQAIDLANLYAPEHLSLMVTDPGRYIGHIKNAGCICAGQYSPVVMGDYVAGPSHALPTGGSARFSSPLVVQDFLKINSIIALDDDQMVKLGPSALLMAENEGLTGHAHAVRIRLDKKKTR